MREMSLSSFHPVIERWFASRFAAPTEPQEQGWPHIVAGENTLIAAPTGSGKTLTAFLAAIDRLLKLALAGELHEQIRVVYVSPLRALSNDMHRNLEVPLQEIFALASAEFPEVTPIRVGLRTGDTTPAQRAALVRHPPHILVTTPESLYLMLTGSKSRETLRSVESVIVDEVHALVRDKRGSHLALSLERLAALCPRPLQRIGLSATQRPIERTGWFLTGCGSSTEPGVATATPNGETTEPSDSWIAPIDPNEAALGPPPCVIIDVGHGRQLDLAIEIPPSELGAVCMHEQWAEVHARIAELVNQHRSTLIFVNTRRMAERVTHQLSELLGEDAIRSHHGSLSADIRLDTERRLKAGILKAVVATSSLELGLDVGYIDLVIQLGSPRSIAGMLQRVGRSGHSLGLIPKGRLFALTRDELLECMALIRAVRSGQLDRVTIPEAPLDILAQQIVAEVAHREWNVDELFALVCQAFPYRNLPRQKFDQVIEFLSEGISQTAGRGRVYLHHDQVQRRVRTRKGASIAATTGGGAIPEIATYRVVTEPERVMVGSLDEDFAVESMAGDVFLLGNSSWRIQYVRGGEVVVHEAPGAPPTIPFWLGEGPGRTMELSAEVSRLREDLEAHLEDSEDAEAWLVEETGVCESAARQAVSYAAAQQAAIGLLPSQHRVVFERFFDESGGMQLVIHAPFGARITRAWGWALRKRFCRSFDFELQATADDEGMILSLGPQHSFPLESMFAMLNEHNVKALLEQALLAVPMFQTHWRWNVTRALLVMRQQNGKKVPPPLQRFRAEDLLTAVFPKLTGCQENTVGDIQLPDQPLVTQTMEDCLHLTLDLTGLERVLAAVQSGDISLVARDTREPSPFSYELLNSNPYAFLDGGEIQERRARAVSTRRSLTVESVSDLGRLDPLAIEQVRLQAQPLVRSADELHDALLGRILLPVCETSGWDKWYRELVVEGRATTVTLRDDFVFWGAAERIPAILAAYPGARCEPQLTAPEGVRHDWTDIDARLALFRGWMELCGPITASELGARLDLTAEQSFAALEALEGEGVVLRGRFTVPPKWSDEASEDSSAEPIDASPQPPKSDPEIEWCHRRLLARIHRLTLEGLRREIQPVGVETYLRFLTRHHGMLAEGRQTGPNGLFHAISQLQGIDAPAVSWERDLLPARLEKYRPEWLDELCLNGEVGWGRLFPTPRDPEKSRPMASLTRVAPISFFLRTNVGWLAAQSAALQPDVLSSPAREVFELLQTKGAMFPADIMNATRLLPAQLDEVLGELITHGFINADGFAGLRKLIAKKDTTSRRELTQARRRGIRMRASSAGVGRWSLWRTLGAEPTEREMPADIVEQWAWQLLRRWGVLFRDLLVREQGAPRWWQLLQVLRRMEARGEIRGGRFVAGVGGEQFALGDTVKQLRQLRDAEAAEELVIVSGADPLNLVGILTEHPRVPSTAANRIAYRNGVPVAALQGGEVLFLTETPSALQKRLTERLKNQSVVDDAPEFPVPSLIGTTVVQSHELPADATTPTEAPTSPTKRRRPEPPRRIPRPTIY